MKLQQSWNAVVIAALIALPCPAFPQQEGALAGVPTKVVVSVEPRHGKEVPEVRQEDVIVLQGKQRDKVIAWQRIQSPEIGEQLFLLIDESLSSSEIGTKLNDIRDFINSQPATVLVGVAYMRNGTAVIAQNPTSDRAQAAKALRLTTGDGGGNASPYFALQDLLKKWQASNAARQVVMITDGIDRYWDGVGLDDPYVNSAIEQAQRGSVVVNALYAPGEGHFGHSPWRINLGQSFLSEIVDASGGEAYYLANGSPVTFRPYFTELSARMAHQYLLTFEAQPGQKSGLQRLKLNTEVPNAELVTQTQVYVPAGP